MIKSKYIVATLEVFIEELKYHIDKNPALKDYLVKLCIPDSERGSNASIINIKGIGFHKTEKEFYIYGPPLEWLVVKNYLEDRKNDYT